VAALREQGVEATLHDPAGPGSTVRYSWKAAIIPLRLASGVATAAAVRRDAPDLMDAHHTRGWAERSRSLAAHSWSIVMGLICEA